MKMIVAFPVEIVSFMNTQIFFFLRLNAKYNKMQQNKIKTNVSHNYFVKLSFQCSSMLIIHKASRRGCWWVISDTDLLSFLYLSQYILENKDSILFWMVCNNHKVYMTIVFPPQKLFMNLNNHAQFISFKTMLSENALNAARQHNCEYL